MPDLAVRGSSVPVSPSPTGQDTATRSSAAPSPVRSADPSVNRVHVGGAGSRRERGWRMAASERTGRAGQEAGGRSGRRTPWGVIALVLLAGLALVRGGSGQYDTGPPQPARAAAPGAAHGSTPSAPAAQQGPLPRSVPVRVTIPAILVDAPVIPVGVDEDGAVAAPPPQDANLAGWFERAVTPGEQGTAVVVGHVDNSRGPAVFYALGALEPGNHVEIRREDGRTAVFEVYDVQVVAKKNFPGERVYGATGSPELRVITCGGRYTEQSGYESNVVVFARLTDVR